MERIRSAADRSASGRARPQPQRIRVAAFCLTVVALATARAVAAPSPAAVIKVAAASDLAFAFKEVGAAFETRSGERVVFSFGSTGLLTRQIIEGAPFDVFAAANASFVDDAVRAGRCLAETKAPYARGRIVVWWRADAAVPPPVSLADLASPRWKHIAIANPAHAPYGRAAEQALRAAGVWDAAKPKLVYGENVQQALQFAQSGNADVAIVALSLGKVAPGGATLPIAESQHQPIDQALALCRGAAPDGGRRFIAFLASEEGRAIMRHHGFLLPGEASTVQRR